MQRTMSVARPLPFPTITDYWCMGKEERSRMEERKEYQHQ
jgi:hypothetical protein